MTEVRSTSAMQVIATALGNGSYKSLLDVGCGSGGLRPHIERLGVSWTGVDPALQRNNNIHCARAEALPFDTAQFETVLFLNSLHHIPTEMMTRAIHEALRVLVPHSGPIIVIEPDAEGELSEVLRRIDDETQVRNVAQITLDAVFQSGIAVLQDAFTYIRNERYANFDDFANQLSAADATRKESISENRTALSEDFARLSKQGASGQMLRQPMRVCLLTNP